ncbi:MAG: ABC transporter ATP-binding protein [Candidatus Dormibacteraceae bacterium]
MIALRNIRKRVRLPSGEWLEILRGLDLEIRLGESLAVLGRSGSGKTTLLNVVGLLDRPDCGDYTLGGTDVLKLADRRLAVLRGSHFGFIFQNFFLLQNRTALANVAAPLYHAPPGEFRTRTKVASRLLADVGLGHRLDSLPARLSGGEQQRVAIARSLCRDPHYILADEPTGSLDVDTGRDVLDLLFGLVRRRRRSLILITHDAEVAARADRVLVLRDGVLAPLPA